MVALKVSKNSTLRTARRWGFRLILHFWGMGKFNQYDTITVCNFPKK